MTETSESDVAWFVVSAGMGITDEQRKWRKVFVYTVEDHKHDMEGKGMHHPESRFNRCMTDAYVYATSITDPKLVNHVQLQFVWLR